MIIYRNNSTDPYFNLAAEQYLLDTKQGDIFMLWRNERAVIIGKNQNAYSELDIDYVEKENIKVVRRLTGGGAVFHDIGNINFSFIVSGEENATLDFVRFTKPIIEAIEDLGVKDISLSGRNDILIEGKKISGNAQSCYNNKTLHHGTLLYSSDLSMLSGALKVDEEKIKSKGIKSVRNRVANIKDYILQDMDTKEFMDYLESYVSKKHNCEIVDFTEEDIKAIQDLADEKYSTWDWNFGKSKEFSTQKRKRYPFGDVAVNLTAENGIIKQVKIYGDFFGVCDVCRLEEVLINVKYTRQDIESVIDEKMLDDCIKGMDKNIFLDLLFL